MLGMRTVALVVVLAPSVVGSLAAQGTSWLPPPAVEGAAAQLAQRMRALGEGRPDEEELLTAARRAIDSMIEVVDGWGVEGVLERAPELPGLALGEAGDRYLDAMARYQVCNLVLALQLQDPAYNVDENIRITSIFGLSAVTLTMLRLREPFIAAGGDDTAMEAHLGGPALEPAFEALQQDTEARSHAEEQCGPVVFALLEKPLSGLDAGDGP